MAKLLEKNLIRRQETCLEVVAAVLWFCKPIKYLS
jgi:hypothetical protein